MIPDLTQWEEMMPVGIDEWRIENGELKIYPNPTSGEIQVTSYELQVTSIEIFDVMGRMVANVGALRATPLQDGTINISHLPSGIYFIRIQTETGTITQKIIKN